MPPGLAFGKAQLRLQFAALGGQPGQFGLQALDLRRLHLGVDLGQELPRLDPVAGRDMQPAQLPRDLRADIDMGMRLDPARGGHGVFQVAAHDRRGVIGDGGRPAAQMPQPRAGQQHDRQHGQRDPPLAGAPDRGRFLPWRRDLRAVIEGIHSANPSLIRSGLAATACDGSV